MRIYSIDMPDCRTHVYTQSRNFCSQSIENKIKRIFYTLLAKADHCNLSIIFGNYIHNTHMTSDNLISLIEEVSECFYSKTYE